MNQSLTALFSQKKIWIPVVFLGVVLLILSLILMPSSFTPSPFRVASISPKNAEQNVGIYPTIQISFSSPLTTKDQQQIHISLLPAAVFQTNWQGSTLVLTFSQPLRNSQEYSLTLSTTKKFFTSSFTTVPLGQTSPQDQIKSQAAADHNYGLWEQSVQQNYPWYNQLPFQTEAYFVYFDLNSKQFIAKIYPKKSAGDIDEQVAASKKIIIDRIAGLGGSATSYPISWTITPEP